MIKGYRPPRQAAEKVAREWTYDRECTRKVEAIEPPPSVYTPCASLDGTYFCLAPCRPTGRSALALGISISKLSMTDV